MCFSTLKISSTLYWCLPKQNDSTRFTIGLGLLNSQNMADHDTIAVSLTILYVIAMIVALAGSTLLIYIGWKKPGVRNPTSFLFVNMAVAELVVALFQMLVSIAHSGHVFQAYLCRFHYYAGYMYVSFLASIFCLTAMAFDRYFAVMHPFRRSIWFRKRKIITPVIWISSMALMSIIPVAFKLVRGRCRIDISLVLPFYAIFFAFGFLLPFAVISVLYTLVARKLWLHEVPVDHNVSESQREQEIPKKKVIRILIIVVVVFVVCWLPMHVYQMDDAVSIVVSRFTRRTEWDPYVIYICYCLSQANSAINLWLYIGLNGKMKAAFKNMIRCRHEEITGRRQPTLALTTRRNRLNFTKNTMMEDKM